MIQGELFKDDVRLAIELLEGMGYSVIPPKKNITIDCRKLMYFFYDRLNFYRKTNSYKSFNFGRDLKLAKDFAQSLFERGCPSEKIWDFSHNLIEFMLKYENKLGLKTPITNMSILGQNKMRWVTDKTILLMNEELAESKEIGREDLDNQLDALQDELVEETINKDPDDLEKILRSIKYGKKEND